MQALNSLLKDVDDSWKEILRASLLALDEKYLDFLLKDEGYFPSKDNFLNAFKTLPLQKTKYILFGQDPYPRKESATGYAFIDGKVKDIFSQNGFSKEVNKATSLRNFLKMTLLCAGKLQEDNLSQEAISKLDKNGLCKELIEVKRNFEKNGVLLLNISLIFTSKDDAKHHFKIWKKFLEIFLKKIDDKGIELILFGNIAKDISNLKSSKDYKKHLFKHPYNIDFIHDKKAHRILGPMRLIFC